MLLQEHSTVLYMYAELHQGANFLSPLGYTVPLSTARGSTVSRTVLELARLDVAVGTPGQRDGRTRGSSRREAPALSDL